MFDHIMDSIVGELNTGLCLRDIANHWMCRCTVPGPGMRQAGNLLKRRYRENGVANAELIPYPADDRTEFFDGHKNPLEWQPHSASLAVVQPAAAAVTICRYADEPLCLVSNSPGTPSGGVTAAVVVRDGALGEAAVTEGEFAGKLLFTNQPPGSVEAAARKGQAVGVISDCVCPPWLVSYPPVREPEDAPDLVMWTIFSGRSCKTSLFGFNLSARQGRRLRQLLAVTKEPVVLKAVVKARLVEGSSDFVHAALPGTDLADEEIWVLAHLSEPGARDNASGCCLSVELARTLHALIAAGTLPPLRRTIRFMHAVEVSGFLPYIDANRERLGKVVAGLCLDSVGQDFSICGGELVLFRAPEQNASFIDGLFGTLLEAVNTRPVARFSKNNYATLPWHTKPFWGNDAFISDGFFDAPAPQLSTWPDRYYHSSMDTPDQMSDNTLARVGAATGTYLYLLATAGAREARWFAHLAAGDWKGRVCREVTEAATRRLTVESDKDAARKAIAKLHHLGLQGADAVTQAARFAPRDARLTRDLQNLARGVQDFVDAEAVAAARTLGLRASRAPRGARKAEPGANLVARRLRWRAPGNDALPTAVRKRLEALSQTGGKKVDLGRIWPWINGRRTVGEICDRLAFGGEIPLPAVVEYLRLLARVKAVALSTARR
ncbi:MAG: hypothetical protein A3K19_11040 [Lentisphaerae bacterium RIFOXYB12_FULL_65_16]|nr:MAG: hypothetical protein A3K18_15090 [Lentisphaerae bacterium RIFOXYA12_64_32]OGV94365.1 MAG: hypothetical protein A3K19_11040 [Lentisphaerae bacterium RIFOXYB12_FULL_65_16]